MASNEAIAAAWATWKTRPGWKLGPGPGFVEAIDTALAVELPQIARWQKAKIAARECAYGNQEEFASRLNELAEAEHALMRMKT